MTIKQFSTTIIAYLGMGIINTVLAASAYISHEPLEKQLPTIILGSLSGIFLFLFVNWLFKPRTKKTNDSSKKR